ncbi:unnamed protein product [Prorocentrum cordatum]|uniref:Carboxylesterase type B domain-containing protein n=1 Tax=Prorocentrum cordatum TaxID=2364126 RepID=A0ABN9WPF2_9DINO|nr:unnamed protein product [Polarella glacialis]
MVGIHGGGFQMGSGSEALYDGANLAAKEGVMVVTLNYRLGSLGFLQTGPDGQGGMNGLLDQIRALEWVNRSISSFGGDPAKVTSSGGFGQSAGSMSICMLSVSPLAKDLFLRAILESAVCINEPTYGMPNSAEKGENLTRQVLEAAKVENVEGLKNISVEEVLKASAGLYGGPSWDLSVLPASPADLYSDPAGRINPADMMIGSNTFDDSMFVPCGGADFSSAYLGGAANYMTGLRDAIYVPPVYPNGEESANEVFDAYSPDDVYNGSNVTAFMQQQGDYQRICFGRELASAASSNIGGKIYAYMFGHNPSAVSELCDDPITATFRDDPTWSFHGAEIPFVFGNPVTSSPIHWPQGAQPVAQSAEEAALQREMMARWANFARSGNPHAPSGNASSVEWEPVPKHSRAAPERAAADPPYLFFTGGGSRWISSNEHKAQQCTPIVRADSAWSGRCGGRGEQGRSGSGSTLVGSALRALRKRSGRTQGHLRSVRGLQGEGDAAAMLQVSGAAPRAPRGAGDAGQEL